jgi:hypothetical protein
VRDIETIDAELRLVAAFRHAARERGCPLPSIDKADALLDERRELTGVGMMATSGLGRRASQSSPTDAVRGQDRPGTASRQ